MTIKIIGARALNPIQSKLVRKFTCGEVKSGKTVLRIDAGVKAPGRPNLQLITHLHLDHFGRIGALPKGTQVCVPHKEFVKKLQKHQHLKVKRVRPQQPFQFGPFKITPFKVFHSKHTPAFGYRIESEGKAVLWLSDFRRLKGATKFFKNLDALFIGAAALKRDITHADHEKYGHMAITKTLAVLRRNHLKPKQIYLIHLGRGLAPLAARVQYLCQMFPYFKIDFAWDGRVIKI